jgi:hypothetical protein
MTPGIDETGHSARKFFELCSSTLPTGRQVCDRCDLVCVPSFLVTTDTKQAQRARRNHFVPDVRIQQFHGCDLFVARVCGRNLCVSLVHSCVSVVKKNHGGIEITEIHGDINDYGWLEGAAN